VHMVMNVPVEEYPRIRTKLMQPHGGLPCQWMPLTHHNHERVCSEAKGRYAHLSPAFMAAAVNKLDGVFAGALPEPK